MKILLVNTSDIEGGAARAAKRLHDSLKSLGVQSKMLVLNKRSIDPDVISLGKSKVEKVVNIITMTIDLLFLFFYKKKRHGLFSSGRVGVRRVIKRIKEVDPDIVHIHWVNQGMLSVRDIKKIRVPVVFSLHDMWLFTGGCHYNSTCLNYLNRCGHCETLGSKKSKDISRGNYKIKKEVFSAQENMTVVGLSRWLAGAAQESSLLAGKKIVNLPNPIDTRIFRPHSKILARDLWNLPKNKKIILFGAMNAQLDPRKGFRELVCAIEQLNPDDVELVVFGGSHFNEVEGFRVHHLGRLHDDVSLVSLYNAADVMVVPSLQENLSNAIMESLSCGTPVVAFGVGGNRDLIMHRKNGYLAEAFDSADLARGIEWVLASEKQDELRRSARDMVLKNFESSIVGHRYISLYREILDEGVKTV